MKVLEEYMKVWVLVQAEVPCNVVLGVEALFLYILVSLFSSNKHHNKLSNLQFLGLEWFSLLRYHRIE